MSYCGARHPHNCEFCRIENALAQRLGHIAKRYQTTFRINREDLWI